MAKRRVNSSESEISSMIKSSDIEALEVSSVEEEYYENTVSSSQENADNVVVREKAPKFTSASALSREELLAHITENFSKNQKYIKLIRGMCTRNEESIEIQYGDVSEYPAVHEDPEAFIEILDEALTKITAIYFPNYRFIKPQIHGRIVDLPIIESIRDLRNVHLNRLVRIGGIVTRRSGVFSLYSIVRYTCMKCNATFGPFIGKDLKPSTCFECQSKGPFTVNVSETVYKDFQRITVQEVPSAVPAGSLPRSREVLLYYDLIDSCKPGDEVDIVGIYKNNYSISLNIKNGFPVFSTVVDCVSLHSSTSKSSMDLSEDDVREIKNLSKHPRILEVLSGGVAPSIYGHKDIKTALLLALVGGEPKERNGMRIRGDINILLMGDPGTAKSQFLRYLQRISHRAVLATGQGSSSVGLTASVRRDPMLKEWVLEGGALVLADSGVCLIDEFDKMGENDRVAIHEAMEQQSVSISKAGIVASLHARCSVIAAANPVRGRYNPSLTFSQNINLGDPLVSRFDVLFVVKDEIDGPEDRAIARFILERGAEPAISEDLLRKYLFFAKENVHPKSDEIDVRKITQIYLDLRKESRGVPITVRHIESVVRIAEAFAKLRLSAVVSRDDVNRAISLALRSFISTQKYSVSKQLRKKLSKYFDENVNELVLYILKGMAAERLGAVGSPAVTRTELLNRCRNSGVVFEEKFFDSEPFKAQYKLENERITRI